MLCDKLRFLRLQRQLSQAELAEKTGLSLQAISSYEAGIWQPGKPSLDKLAVYFQTTAQEIEKDYRILYDKENYEAFLVSHNQKNSFTVISRVPAFSSMPKQEGEHI